MDSFFDKELPNVRKEVARMEYTTELGLKFLEDEELWLDFFGTLDDEDAVEVIMNGLEDCLYGEYYQKLLKEYCLDDEDWWNEFIEKIEKEGKENV